MICAAASTIDDPDARAALGREGLLLVWLRADPATLAGRTPGTGHRRDLGPDLAAGLAGQAALRYPRFEALDPLVIDVDDIAAGGGHRDDRGSSRSRRPVSATTENATAVPSR